MILKKPYLTPRIEFEEIEADEREMLMESTTDVTVPHPVPGPGDEDPESLEADFVVNDANSEFKW